MSLIKDMDALGDVFLTPTKEQRRNRIVLYLTGKETHDVINALTHFNHSGMNEIAERIKGQICKDQ